MTTTKWILIVLSSLALIGMCKAACYTNWGIKGQCINIKNCDHMYDLLKQLSGLSSEKQPKILNVLKKAQCGFEGLYPKVCCAIANNKTVDTETTKSKFKKVIVNKKPRTTTTRTTTMKTTTSLPPIIVPLQDHPNRRLLDENVCGPITESRIFGGNYSSIFEFPWMALLGYDVGLELPEFRCGASLISKRYVLTAAHCTTSLPEDMDLVNVRIGDWDLSTERDCDNVESGLNCAPKYQEFGIDRVHVHPEYSKRTMLNDIAIIRLNDEADISVANVRPICLPFGKATFLKARSVVVTGWGSTESGVRSDKLVKVELPIVTMEKCKDIYRKRFRLWHKQICAGGNYGMDSCSGDSGGPLQTTIIQDGDRARIVQYGIVSYGPKSCGSDGFPGIYTSVSHYVRWILDEMTE